MPDPTEHEALLVANRLWELNEFPVAGRFDTAHLCEIHRRLFQGLSQYHPGQFRPEGAQHLKARALDSLHARYYVPYAPRKLVKDGLAHTHKPGLLSELSRLSVSVFAKRMAALYGDLDYWHAFEEGNSRTLREFTRQLARPLRVHPGLGREQCGWSSEGRSVCRSRPCSICASFPGSYRKTGHDHG